MLCLQNRINVGALQSFRFAARSHFFVIEACNFCIDFVFWVKLTPARPQKTVKTETKKEM